MRTTLILTILLTSLLLACGKNTQVKGIVYSKHNIPVPNVSVGWEEYRESNYPEKMTETSTKTNNKGEYVFSFSGGRKKFLYKVRCVCDSGSKNASLDLNKTNNIDLYLEQ